MDRARVGEISTLQAELVEKDRDIVTESERLAAAWEDLHRQREEFEQERNASICNLTRKKQLIEAKDCFWYCTGAKFRLLSALLLGMGISAFVFAMG